MKKISEYYNNLDRVKLKELDVFDAIIGIDNPYFFDPSLIPYIEASEFENSHEELLDYFKKVIALIKTGNKKYFDKAVDMLTQPDLKGASTGYGENDDGAGVGPRLARILAENAKELINHGNEDPIIFEIIGMFTPDFGPDRLSDLICGILKKNIYSFTERISKELSIDTVFNVTYGGENFSLPIHPNSNKKPILFFPESVLSPLPIALSWDDLYQVAVFNTEIRERFNNFLQPLFKDNSNPNKNEIREYIFSDNLENKVNTLIEIYKTAEPKRYDFKKDPANNYRWYDDAAEIFKDVEKPNIEEPSDLNDLMDAVSKIVMYFKGGVEKYMWKHSYDEDGKPKKESYFQSIFLLVSEIICGEKNIDVSAETDKGRGPVDFKLSRGSTNVTVEMKLTSNNNLLKGFNIQLPIYVKAEKSKHSYFVVVQTTETSKQLEYVRKIIKNDKPENITLIEIDALPKESASKAKEIS